MGYEVGTSGAFGLLLSEHADKLGGIYTDFLAAVQLGDPEADEYERFSNEAIERIADDHVGRIIEAFKSAGIIVPEEADIFWTGNGDDRPGRCSTPIDDFVLGFGIFTRPGDHPPMDETFKKAAQFHTWVWGG